MLLLLLLLLLFCAHITQDKEFSVKLTFSELYHS
jgi:hypothetical protein